MSLRPARYVRPAVVLAATIGFAGCTLLGSREIRQCETKEDCKGNETRVFCNQNLCSTIDPDPKPDAKEDGPVVAQCTTTCPGFDVCLDGGCVPLAQGPCPRLAGIGTPFHEAFKEPGAVTMGVYVYEPNGNGPDTAGVEKAIEQINAKLVTANDPLRIAAVFCAKPTTYGDGGVVPAALAHLKSRQIPVLAGQLEIAELEELKKSGTQGIAVMSTLANSPDFQQPAGSAPGADPPMRFLVDEMARLAPAFGEMMIEAKRRANLIVPPAGAMKIRIAASAGIESQALKKAIEDSGVFSGDDYNADEISKLPEGFIFGISGEVPTATEQIRAAKPNIVIVLGGDETVNLISRTESNYVTNGEGALRPIWVVGPRSKYTYQDLADIVTRFGTGNVLRKRLLGVDFAGNQTKAATMRSDVDRSFAGAFAHLYDSIHATTLAAKRARRDRGPTAVITGADFVQAFDATLEAPAAGRLTVDSPLNFSGGVAEVGAGKAIHLTGVTGAWLFPVDTKRGVRRMGASFYCFATNSSEPTVHLDPTHTALESASACAQP